MRALLACLVLPALLVLVVLPAAAAALPPEYGWAWPDPYAWQPRSGDWDEIRRLATLASGPPGSIYAATDEDCGGYWTIVRVATADGSELSAVPPTRAPLGGSAVLNALTSDPRGNAVGVGAADDADQDVLVVKVSPAGKVLWQRTWDGRAHENDVATAVATDARGNIYVAGLTQDKANVSDALVLKYSPGGVLRWKYVYKTAAYDLFVSVALDAKGAVYVTGTVNDAYRTDEIATLKLDGLGRRVWLRRVS